MIEDICLILQKSARNLGGNQELILIKESKKPLTGTSRIRNGGNRF